jgi:4'-phosphopantetheinyl transferase
VSKLQAIDPGADRAAVGIDLRLWWIDLDAPSGAQTALPDVVLRRAARFARDQDRRRYLASHVAWREALRSCGGLSAWVQGAHGKPALASTPPHFNASRREAAAAIGVSRTHEIGVDVETLRSIDDGPELAALHFTPRERDAVADDEGFLRVWTSKEACMKATGLGLALAPSSFECGAQARPQRVHVRTAQRAWTLLVHTPPVDAPLVVSWAVVLA